MKSRDRIPQSRDFLSCALTVMLMKTIIPFLLLLMLPLCFKGQSLSGVWTGTLSNDSQTVRKDQQFELALTEYRGKIYGYSRTTFIVNDTLYYVVKRVKGIVGDSISEVTDDKILTSNFPGRIDKGVKVTTTFRLNKADSIWRMDGNWKTNATRRYYSISGSVSLAADPDPSHSRIMAHLQELGQGKDLVLTEKKTTAVPQTKPVSKPLPPSKQTSSLPVTSAPAERITVVTQTISFTGDSLQLALYDNGEIDGDTVSVLLNDEVILSRQLLKQTAIRHTVHIPASAKEVKLVLYAENLGRYPPNTGLLIIRDGAKEYSVRYSANLQQNAAIVLRRKE